jgi:hypothetical protein
MPLLMKLENQLIPYFRRLLVGNKVLGFALLCYLLLMPYLIQAQTNELFNSDSLPESVPENLDIYLVIGQSNMAGRAKIREEDKAHVAHAYLFTGDTYKPWVLATNPLNRHSTVRKNIEMQRLGPAYSFAKNIVKARPNNEIGLVANSRGGTKIVQWLPGTELYEAAVNQMHKALKYGKLKGVIWLQGSGDVDPLRVNMYLGRLEVLVNALREEFNDPTLPFVAGQLFEVEKRHAFNTMLLDLPGFIRYSGVVTSDGTQSQDGTHFDSESAILIGERFAKEMLILIDEVDAFADKKRKKK